MMRVALLSLALLGPVWMPAAVLAEPGAALECATLAGGPMIEARLFFGRNIGDRLGVSDKAWARFVDREVTPRFPDGLTIQDASGHWRDSATGRLIREPSKVLTLLVGQDAESLDKIRAIAEAYKTRFKQQAVGTVLRPACVGF